jgi:hypothetical protein
VRGNITLRVECETKKLLPPAHLIDHLCVDPARKQHPAAIRTDL